jgi:thymidylate synthase ThyX
LRLDSHAQQEIQEYAKAVRQIVEKATPVLYRCWIEEKTN